MTQFREVILLSDSDDERPSTTVLEETDDAAANTNKYDQRRQKSNKPPQKSSVNGTSESPSFTSFGKAFHATSRATPTTIPSRPQTILIGLPGRTSVLTSMLERRRLQSTPEVPAKSPDRPQNEHSAPAASKIQGPPSRLFTPNYAPASKAPTPSSSEPRLRGESAANRTQRDGLDSQQGSTKPGARQCKNCARYRATCDGLSPCSSCKRQVISCVYQESDLHLEPRRTLIVKLPIAPRSSESDSNDTADSVVASEDRDFPSEDYESAESHQKTPFAQDTLTAVETVRNLQGSRNGHGRKISHDASIENEIDHDMSDGSLQPLEIDLDYDAVRKLVDTIQNDQYDWQERSTQASLRQAIYDMKVWPRPTPDSTLPPPEDSFIRTKLDGEETVINRRETDASAKVPSRTHYRKAAMARADETRFKTEAVILPKYKAIGRVSSSFLAPNRHTQKYRPYDAEDEVQDPDVTEKYLELEQRFNNNYDGLKAQRDCQELIWLWKPWAEELLRMLHLKKDHILYYFVRDYFEPDRQLTLSWSATSASRWNGERTRKCGTCDHDHDDRVTSFSRNMFDELDRPDDRSLGLAGLAACAFHEVSNISMWHVVVGGCLQPLHDDREDDENGSDFCAICFRHYCPDHGNFIEDRDEDQAEQSKAYVNDGEKQYNVRQFMSLPSRDVDNHEPHICGIFCVDPSQELPQLLGRQPDGTISGDCRITIQYRQGFKDNELCSDTCFWEASGRRKIKISEVNFQPFPSVSHKVLVDKLMRFYLNHARGPCIISRIVNTSCHLVFNYMIWSIRQRAHPNRDLDTLSDSSAAHRQQGQVKKKRKPLAIVDVSRSAELEQRPPFLPCSHEGPCHNDPNCNCYRHKVHCERFCGCDDSCRRRFKGCNCVARGNRVCFKDNRCECYKANRECDPALCGKCGVVEVLESSNKYNDEVRQGRCRNNRIQLGLPAPTTKAPSQIQGYGLYSRAEIPKEDFIGEYTGEVISKSEGNRRGAMYHVLGQEYLFTINKAQEIDASNNGNKMRFMNNSQREEHINVEPKVLWCSGVVRVGLFAKRHIKAGEELLYNYNYPESKVQYFWEPGERPANTRAVLPLSQEHVTRTTATSKKAEERLRDDSSQSPLLSRHPKRKRPLEDSPDQYGPEKGANVSGQDSDSWVDEAPPMPEIEDSEDSEYRTNGHVSEEEEIEESDMDAEVNTRAGTTTRRANPRGRAGRLIGATSRRPVKRSRINGTATARQPRRKNDQLDGAVSSSGAIRSHASSRGVHIKSSKGKLVIRKRKIGPNDRRFGGRAQQLAWQTRRMNEAMASGNGK